MHLKLKHVLKEFLSFCWLNAIQMHRCTFLCPKCPFIGKLLIWKCWFKPLFHFRKCHFLAFWQNFLKFVANYAQMIVLNYDIMIVLNYDIKDKCTYVRIWRLTLIDRGNPHRSITRYGSELGAAYKMSDRLKNGSDPTPSTVKEIIWPSNMLKIFKSCSDLDIEPRTLEIEIAWDVIILNIFVKLY